MSIGRVPGDTGIQPSIVDAKGDLIVATAADSVSRLAVGANNTVLTADSAEATGVKWAAASSTPSYVGCVMSNSVTQTLSNATATVITFDTESLDTDGFHSTSSNTGRITIPTGKGGKYNIFGGLSYAVNATGARAVYLRVNGTTYKYYWNTTATSAQASSVIVNYVLSLAAGDYVEMLGYQSSGGNLNVVGDNSDPGTTVFGCTYLGA